MAAPSGGLGNSGNATPIPNLTTVVAPVMISPEAKDLKRSFTYTIDCDLRHKKSGDDTETSSLMLGSSDEETSPPEVEPQKDNSLRPKKRLRTSGHTDSEDEEPTSTKELTAEEIQENIESLSKILDPLGYLQSRTSTLGRGLVNLKLNTDFTPFVEAIEQDMCKLQQHIVACKRFYTFLLESKQPVQAEFGYFGMLPIELLIKIFSFLSGKDLIITSCVCTLFHKAAEDESLWKRIAAQSWPEEVLLQQKPSTRSWRWLFDSKMRVFTKDDEKNGRGTYVLEHGNTYEGEWKDDRRHGYGTGIMQDGRRYDGEWKDDMRSGFGIFRWPTCCARNGGDSYAGYWKDSKRHGAGVYCWADGTKYDGQWKEGKREGHGTVTWPDGRKYTGDYKDGKMEGRGVFTWPDGSVYEGEYKAGRRHGYGLYTYRQGGGIYRGAWKTGNREGWGVLVKSNGDRYEGNWKDNQPCGWGVMSYSDGTVIKKMWVSKELPLEP